MLHYDWAAGLTFIAMMIAINKIGPFLAFRVPVLRKMREMNVEVDERKLARKSYRDAVRVNGRTATVQAFAFYLIVLPFCVSFETMPFWRYVVDIVAVLMIYDFGYYLVHRFLLHGRPLRRIHALHHQARAPTYTDAIYVHPVETLIGQGLFQLSIPIVAVLSGGTLNVFAMLGATLIFFYAGSLNHAWVHLPRFPFKWLQFLTTGHAAHHVDMNHGNYSQVTLFYDWLFGTYEKPVVRPAP